MRGNLKLVDTKHVYINVYNNLDVSREVRLTGGENGGSLLFIHRYMYG